MELVEQIWQGSGLYQMTGGQAAMLGICLLLLYLGIVKKFEPLLLVTIGFGGLLSNIPGVEIATGDGLLHLFYVAGIETGAFPLIIFMGVGALTDFGPLLANPRTLFLGAAAQFGIFATLLGALGLTAILCRGKTRAQSVGRYRRRRIFLHGACAADPATDNESADDRGRAQDRDGAIARGIQSGAHRLSFGFTAARCVAPALGGATNWHARFWQPDA
jgi:hypothetical protein